MPSQRTDGPKRRSRGDGRVEELPSGRFRAILPGRDRAGASRTFETAAAARKWLREQADKPRGDAAPLAQWLDQWVAIQTANAAAKTVGRDIEVVEAFIRPQLGADPIRAITTTRLNTWLSNLHAAGRSDDQRHRAWGTLRKILRAHESFPRERLDRVKTPKVRRKEMRSLTPAQYVKLCEVADGLLARPWFGAMVRVCVECCCRPRELHALRRADYRDGVMSIRRAICPQTAK